jgi:ferredoxin--NADP+ reductase
MPESAPVTRAGNAGAEKFTSESITWLHQWADHLFSFRTTRPKSFRFTPGQFARLGVYKPGQEKPVWRAYSMASASYDEHLEFYSIVVPRGEFTTELYKLRTGDSLLIDKTSYGFLTLDRFVDGRHLWLLSTGTGLAPFLSILHDLDMWERYERVIVVHSVRQVQELVYRDVIEGLRTHPHFRQYAGKLTYLPSVTREQAPGALHARITTLLADGRLETAAQLALGTQDSRIMLCGNPQMVEDTRAALKARGFTTSRQARPGQIAVENYW